jgi:hypothetical protein
MNTDQPLQTPQPGVMQALPDGVDPPTLEDPTAQGYLCGARRKPARITEDDPWPYCRNRAGWKTGHVGAGRCRLHGGSSPVAERNHARLRLIELVGPALSTLARVMVDEHAPAAARVRAAEAVLDRTGYPRRTEISVDEGREMLTARIEQAMGALEDHMLNEN